MPFEEALASRTHLIRSEIPLTKLRIFL
jgi:hypothetical protein